MTDEVRVANGAELTHALANGATTVEILGTITGTPSLTVPPRVSLRGGTIGFKAKGPKLASNNSLSDVRVVTAESEAAIVNDISIADFGTLAFANVTTIGQIYLVTNDQIQAGRIIADHVTLRQPTSRASSIDRTATEERDETIRHRPADLGAPRRAVRDASSQPPPRRPE